MATGARKNLEKINFSGLTSTKESTFSFFSNVWFKKYVTQELPESGSQEKWQKVTYERRGLA